MRFRESQRFISLKSAAKISGYNPDYIGWLIRKGKIEGRKVYSGASWKTTKDAILAYKTRKKALLQSQPKRSQEKQTLKEYISLKKAAEISGYTPDYISWLIRKGKIPGKKVYTGVSWQTSAQAIKKYQTVLAGRRQEGFRNSYPRLGSAKKIVAGIFGLSSKSSKIFNIGWRFSLAALIIFFLTSGFLPVKFLHGSLIEAIAGGGTKTVDFYPTISYGDWQNPQNVQGPPDVLPNGSLDSFSEANSAVYKKGPLSIVLGGFSMGSSIPFSHNGSRAGNSQPARKRDQNQNVEQQQHQQEQQEQQEQPKQQPKPGGIKKDRGPVRRLLQITSHTRDAFIRKTERFFGSRSIAQADEEQVFQSAKIKISLAVGARKPDFFQEGRATSYEQQNTGCRKLARKNAEDGFSQTRSDASIDHKEEGSEILSGFDKKIVIWYSTSSLNDEDWEELDSISDSSLSNALNGGYFTYDAPFLKNSEDIKNLKIKFEGVVGGESDVVAYLDSVWIEVAMNRNGKAKNKGCQKDEDGEIIGKFFLNNESELKKKESGEPKILRRRFKYIIPEDGRITAIADSMSDGVADGLFRISFYSGDDKLVGVLNVVSGELSEKLVDSNNDVPWPRPQNLSHSLVSVSKYNNRLSLNVKKSWGETKIIAEYIPFSMEGNTGFDNLELKFEDKPISLNDAQPLVELSSGPKEKNNAKVDFENFSSSSAGLIVDITQSGRGGGAHFLYLDGKGIGFVESGYVEERVIFPGISPGEHQLTIRHGDCRWNDNTGERKIKIYLK